MFKTSTWPYLPLSSSLCAMTSVSFPNYSSSLVWFASRRRWSSRFKWLGGRSASRWRSIRFFKVILHWRKCYRFSSLLYVVGITNYQQYKWFFPMTSFRWSCPRLNHYQVVKRALGRSQLKLLRHIIISQTIIS